MLEESLKAMKVMSGEGILHFDLKPSNIMMNCDWSEKKCPEPVIKSKIYFYAAIDDCLCVMIHCLEKFSCRPPE